MLIHSVTSPLMLTEQQPYPEIQYKPFEGGFIGGYETEEGFKLSQLCSTDPGLYLNKEFSPGGICKVK